MFEFEDTLFNSSMVAAIELNSDTVIGITDDGTLVWREITNK